MILFRERKGGRKEGRKGGEGDVQTHRLTSRGENVRVTIAHGDQTLKTDVRVAWVLNVLKQNLHGIVVTCRGVGVCGGGCVCV